MLEPRSTSRPFLGELLVDEGHLSRRRLRQALHIQGQSHPPQRLGTILLRLRWIDSLQLMEALTRQRPVISAPRQS